MNNYRRSGDHNFHEISKLPKGLKEVKHTGSFVFGVGEKSNHCHTVTVKDREALKIFQDAKGDYYFDLRQDAVLEHVIGGSGKVADHKPIVLPIGIYKQVHEREVDLFQNVVRRVID